MNLKIAIVLANCMLLTQLHSQEKIPGNTTGTSRKGSFFIYWGYNRGFYSASDITFTGENYNFLMKDVSAKDRQSAFNFKTYFRPNNITIPQYNLRIGYFINDAYSISLGADHMKYVMVSNQVVKMTGEIHNSGTAYDGSYRNTDFRVKPDFLLFEHTDGLNYENIELRRYKDFLERKKFTFSAFGGLGIGVLIPRTNTTLLNYKRYDEFHLAGFGFSGVAGVNFEFFKHFFFTSEAKFGFIDMPDIRTTEFKTDRAKQHFSFLQLNGVVGVRFKLQKPQF
ncbi:MAG: hypothetical protein ACO1O6_00640 [Bacteroidota bacterium]